MSLCEKCQDRGFTEENHGLIMVFCDCEKGRELRAEVTGETDDGNPKYLIIPEPLPGKTIDETADIAREIIQLSRKEYDSSVGKVVEVTDSGERLGVVADLTTEGVERLKEIGIISDDSNSGTKSDNSSLGGGDTSKPRQPQKPKARKKARARTS